MEFYCEGEWVGTVKVIKGEVNEDDFANVESKIKINGYLNDAEEGLGWFEKAKEWYDFLTK